MPNQYIFLPWLRRGLAKQIAEADPLNGSAIEEPRPRLNLNVRLLADDVEKKTIPQEVVLIGPGDISGINTSAIVKTEPLAGVNNFEPNFFPFIEFYEEDFPWRYTPAKAAAERRLRTWISLIVLEEGEFERIQNRASRGKSNIHIAGNLIQKVLPLIGQSWAWAHVHVNENNFTTSDLAETGNRNIKIARVLNSNPNLGVSRLMCPRKLKATTKYYAFVVPSFERGRLAGLGAKKNEIEAIGRFIPSWSEQTNSALELPIYYEWSFQTGTEDFEALAKKIVPRDLGGTEVGKLWMDASNINYGDSFDYNGNLEPDKPERLGMLPFEGALKLPGPPSLPMTMRTGQQEKDFVKSLSGLINLGVQYRHKLKSQLQWSVTIPGNDQDDPLLVPPIYGRWYTKPDGDATVDPLKIADWLEQLNLDPAFRVAAGLGSEVVKEYQEEYVSRAWEQLADYRKNLNKELLRLRFAQEVTNATYKKHFTVANDQQGEAANKILALTQSIHGIIKSDEPDLSIAGKFMEYKTEAAFVQPAYRRITRTNGPVMKRVAVKTAYKNVVMSGTAQFFVMAFFINPDPPFQNFNCSEKLIQFNPAKFIFIFIERFRPFNALQIPNWFGNTPGSFQVEREKLPGIFKDISEKLLRKPVIVRPAPTNLVMLSQKIQAKILPSSSFMKRYVVKIPEASPAVVSGSDTISPNSFNPFYKDPTYEQLSKLKPELFIPNLDQVKPESFVLLQANSAFIESFLVGMNHELAAEFLWRGYPADMNATFFRQFWDKSDSAPSSLDKSDIQYIRKWQPNQSLGKNGPPGSFANPLVFVIKAELIRKYPNLVVYAQKAKLINNNQNRVPDMNAEPLSPIFLASMLPDFLFAGFELTKDMVIGNTTVEADKGGWYFVIAERPGEMHFGLDQSRDPNKQYGTWNDLAWTDISQVAEYIDLENDIPADPAAKGGLEWGKGQKPVTADPAAGTGDAAQMAAILRQKPVQIFVHASLMVT